MRRSTPFTRQAALEMVWKHFITRRRGASFSLDSDGRVQCAYVGPNGRTCAVGVLLTAKERGLLTEGVGADDECTTRVLPKEVSSLGIDFLCSLQQCHDASVQLTRETSQAFTSHMRRFLKDLAFEFNLECPE